MSKRTYRFTDEEKDFWANLFEYKGSEPNVRLRFSIDHLGGSIDDFVMTYGEDAEPVDGNGWNNFLENLSDDERFEVSANGHKTGLEYKDPGGEEPREFAEPPQADGVAGAAVNRIPKAPKLEGKRKHRMVLAAVAVLVLGTAAVVIWYLAFRSSTPPVEPASIEKMAFPLPDKPSIAVLPFTNMSEDPKQEFFCDGMTEEIITALSKVPDLFVIARHSTFSYKGKPVKIRRMAEELGVRHVLEGSVRRAGDRVRVSAQLIDAVKVHHLWAERYERDWDLKDIEPKLSLRSLANRLAANKAVTHRFIGALRKAGIPE